MRACHDSRPRPSAHAPLHAVAAHPGLPVHELRIGPPALCAAYVEACTRLTTPYGERGGGERGSAGARRAGPAPPTPTRPPSFSSPEITMAVTVTACKMRLGNRVLRASATAAAATGSATNAAPMNLRTRADWGWDLPPTSGTRPSRLTAATDPKPNREEPMRRRPAPARAAVPNDPAVPLFRSTESESADTIFSRRSPSSPARKQSIKKGALARTSRREPVLAPPRPLP